MRARGYGLECCDYERIRLRMRTILALSSSLSFLESDLPRKLLQLFHDTHLPSVPISAPRREEDSFCSPALIMLSQSCSSSFSSPLESVRSWKEGIGPGRGFNTGPGGAS